MVLSITGENNKPHSSVVEYQSDGNSLYIQMVSEIIKARDIMKNDKVSGTIHFWKNFLHEILPAPPAELHFTAKAEIISKEDKDERKVLKKFIKNTESISIK
ncbi:MAG: hypothetical protein ACTSU4_08800 [Promethearchaeota archaeon]